MVTIKINTDNSAFGTNPSPEVVRILRELASNIEAHGLEGLTRMTKTLLDANGNSTGKITYRK